MKYIIGLCSLRALSLVLAIFMICFTLFGSYASADSAERNYYQKLSTPFYDPDYAACSTNQLASIQAGEKLEGYSLPAQRGATGLEEGINEAGNLVTSSGQVKSEKVTFSKHASLGKEYRDYYITMRWNYVAWNWDGNSADTDDKQYNWMAEKPRLVLVTNPKTNKSIVAVALEAGPAPWTGVDSSGNNTPKQGWVNPQRGTPNEYTGRVSGLPPVAFQALGLTSGDMAYYDKPGQGTVLLYSWAPDQNAKPGPTSTQASSSSSGIPGDSSAQIDSLPAESQERFKSVESLVQKQKSLYEYAAQQTNIKWQYLAALHYREAGSQENKSILNGQGLTEDNVDGIANTWGNDVKKNAVAAAEHFVSNAREIYGVDATNPAINLEDLKRAFLAYNRGGMYKVTNTSADQSPYVMNGYDDGRFKLPMTWPNTAAEPDSTRGTKDSNIGAMTFLVALGIGGGNSQNGCQSAAQGTGCDRLGVGPKLTFPLCITKAEIKAQASKGDPWCYQNKTNCHHDYAAADIFSNEGTVVVAAVGGTVIRVSSPESGKCSSSTMNAPRIQIKADDSLYYYYTHMKVGSLVVKEGQKIKAGDKIGVVGPSECAQGTQTHLHIHRGSAETNCAGTAGCAQHADYNAHSIQPDLVEAYNKLPEN